MKIVRIVGIDVGFSGGIATLIWSGATGQWFATSSPMPAVKVKAPPKRDKHGRLAMRYHSQYDVPTISRIMLMTRAAAIAEGGSVYVAIEELHPRPSHHQFMKGENTQVSHGTITAFRLGRGIGRLEAMAECLLLDPTRNEKPCMVAPQRWQREIFGSQYGKDDSKKLSIRFAKALYPDVPLFPSPRARREHDGMSDAILIAEYGRRMLGERGCG